MITTEMPPTDGTPRSVRGLSSRRRAAIVISTFFLAVVFVFTGAPAATAAPTYPSGGVTAFEDPPPPCRGNKPGICIPQYMSSPLPSQSTTQGSAQESNQQQAP